MRLQSTKILLRWPSRMHIYGFVENRTFFNIMEQFDSMGVPGHFSILWSSLIAWEYQDILLYTGHCYGSSISEGPAPQTERSDSRGGDGPRLNGERRARAYVEARSKAMWQVNSPWEERTK